MQFTLHDGLHKDHYIRHKMFWYKTYEDLCLRFTQVNKPRNITRTDNLHKEQMCFIDVAHEFQRLNRERNSARFTESAIMNHQD